MPRPETWVSILSARQLDELPVHQKGLNMDWDSPEAIAMGITATGSAIGGAYYGLVRRWQRKRLGDVDIQRAVDAAETDRERTIISAWQQYLDERESWHRTEMTRLETEIQRATERLDDLARRERECAIRSAQHEERIKNQDTEISKLRETITEMEAFLSLTARIYKPRILLIEDETKVIDLFTDMLEKSGYTVENATTGFTAIQKIGSFKPDLIILDLKLKSGQMPLLEYIPKMTLVPIIICSAYADELSESDRNVVVAVLKKPLASPTDLLIEVDRHLQHK